MKLVAFQMVNLKKYNAHIKQFVLLLTFTIGFCGVGSLTFVSCNSQKYRVTRIEGKEIGITDKNPGITEIEDYIRPYRENIDKDLSTVLAYSPETLDKMKGEWQTNIGNMMADVSLERSNRVFNKRENKTIDICLLNFGGIRSIIPKGDVTTRTAFEVMPFENSLTVAELKGEQIMEMITYIISEKKAHPLAGLAFTIGKDKQPKDIMVNGKPFDSSRNYFVVTSDYLINGGDNMLFFKKAVNLYDLDYKLRNVLIDYFRETDTIKASNSIRINKEQ